jgi:hypothetical protein
MNPLRIVRTAECAYGIAAVAMPSPPPVATTVLADAVGDGCCIRAGFLHNNTRDRERL